MLRDNQHDFLYLIWKDPETRKNFTVGKLTRAETFQFQYYREYKKAQECGWGKLNALSLIHI